jgi:hypothetical protein
MSEGTKKHLAAVAEVVHSYFQQLFKENKKYIRVDATLHTEGIYKERAMDVSVTIKAGNKYSQAEVMGNWVSANTTSNSASHNPTYVLPNGPHVKHWLWTTYKDSKWYNNIFTGDSNMQTYIDGIEEIDYSDINSEWYKSAYKKNVKDINTWMSAEIMPNHVVQKYQQIQRAAVNWKKIPTVAEAYVGEMFDMPDYQVTPYDQNLGDLVEQGAV